MGKKHQVKISSKRGRVKARRKYRQQEREDLRGVARHGDDLRFWPRGGK